MQTNRLSALMGQVHVCLFIMPPSTFHKPFARGPNWLFYDRPVRLGLDFHLCGRRKKDAVVHLVQTSESVSDIHPTCTVLDQDGNELP